MLYPLVLFQLVAGFNCIMFLFPTLNMNLVINKYDYAFSAMKAITKMRIEEYIAKVITHLPARKPLEAFVVALSIALSVAIGFSYYRRWNILISQIYRSFFRRCAANNYFGITPRNIIYQQLLLVLFRLVFT